MPVTMPSASPMRHHAGAEHVAALVDHALHVAAQVAVALQALVDQVGVGRVARREPRIVDLDAVGGGDADRLHGFAHLLLAADQDRRAVAVVAEHHGGADGALLLALGEDDALRVGLDLLEQALQPVIGRIEAARERAPVLGHVGDRCAAPRRNPSPPAPPPTTPRRSAAGRTAPARCSPAHSAGAGRNRRGRPRRARPRARAWPAPRRRRSSSPR